MVRHSLSKLQGILEMPGFHGYPTGGNMKSGFSSEAIEKQKSFEIPSAQIMPKLNNGRRWVHPGEVMPTHHEDAYRRPSKALTRMNATPLSETTSQSGKANNPETAAVMNPHSIPYYPDLADAQKQAAVQNALADAADSFGRSPTLSELKEAGRLPRKGIANRRYERLSEKKPLEEGVLEFAKEEHVLDLQDFFKQAREIRQKEVAAQLTDKGFSREQIVKHFEREIERDIEKAAREPMSESYMANMAVGAIRASHTGTNATGIVALGATQNPNIIVAALKNEDRPGMYRHLAHNVAPPASWGQPASVVDEVQSVQASEYPSSAASMARAGRAKGKSKMTVLPGKQVPGQSTLTDFLKSK